MRKVVLNLCISLDGYIEGVDGEIDWCFTDQDYGMNSFLASIDSIFFGRKSYDQLTEMAPNAFADKKHVIFSNSKRYTGDNQMGISGDIVANVQKILNEPGKDIWLFGGANLFHSFLELNLVDELIIAVHPLLLGSGKPLLKNLPFRKKLIFKECKPYSTGLVQLFYSIDKK